MTNAKLVVGVLAGVAAGTLVGIAISPRKSKSQKLITRKGEDLANAIRSTIDEKFEDLLEQFEERLAKSKAKE